MIICPSFFIVLCSLLLSCSNAQNDSHQNLHATTINGLSAHFCPFWTFFDKVSKKCHCVMNSRFKCTDHGTYLRTGRCATYDADTQIVSYAICPYFLQSKGLNLTEIEPQVWYASLPDNVSELNHYICGAMNRKGEVCSKCKNGSGPSILSVGFQIQCSNCIGLWYGIPLYLFLELFPITVFYLILLIFQINITTAPMTSYILYSQLIIYATDHIFAGDLTDLSGIILSLSQSYKLLARVMLSMYDVWNLRFFRYLFPPFCISTTIKPIHIVFLGYISVFYPLCLIIFTWVCIELHGRNYGPIVWLWRPFHRCFVWLRKGWNPKSDIIDVFASFILLSFSKSLYQIILLMTPQKVKYTNLNGTRLGLTTRINLDLNMTYGSTEHLVFVIPALITFIIFNVLPIFLLLLYPVGLRACLSKCKLDGLTLYTFVEKFYGCYRDGLDGGRDMRSFAGFHFVLRVILFVTKPLGDWLLFANYDPYFMRNIVLTSASVITSLCRPYKKMYMNVLDVLQLAHLGLFCYLMSAHQSFELQSNFILTATVMILLPLGGFMLLILARLFQQVTQVHRIRVLAMKFKQWLSVFSRSSANEARPLVEPSTEARISYEAIQ